MSFSDLWQSARAILGWAVLGDGDDLELVQLRGTYEKVGWFRQRNVILVRSEGDRGIAQIMQLEAVNVAVLSGFVRSDLGEIDAMTSGTRVSVVPGEDALGVWRTNGAHVGIILDRIAAGELDPSDDLLRCLRGTPASEERLASIDVDAARRKAGSGRVPTEDERLARLRPLLLREEIRMRAVDAFERGDEEAGMELAMESQRLAEESIERRRKEFGGGD